MGINNKLNLIGFHTDLFKVIDGPFKDKNGSPQIWKCLCICGKEFEDIGSRLKRGIKKDCGCRNFTRPHKNRKYDNPQDVSYKALVKRYRNHARHRKIDWLLDEDSCISLFKSNCHYCDIPPSNTFNAYKTKLGRYVSQNISWCEQAAITFNGIDRIDSSKEYTIGNVVPCCKTCNFAKNDLSTEQFMEWINRLCKKYSVFQMPTVSCLS